MHKPLFHAAFAVGLAALAWVGRGYLPSSPLALAMTLLIAGFYLMGALELLRFRQATAGLRSALAALPQPLADLSDWLPSVPAALRNPVRLRIAGERVGLPGPALTPYLVGLLVLLGMLGTFLGMVVTLNGAVLALESTTDLATIRAALAAPVKGLGLAFGTSVAGVAASAMLGLMAALCRRERLQAGQLLDGCCAGPLRVFSLAHQREQTLQALQHQAVVLPDAVGLLQTLMAQIEQRSAQLGTQLQAGQDRFHGQAQAAYADLAASVDRSLQHSLSEGARAAGALIQPVVEATMAGMARQSAAFQAELAQSAQTQLDGLATRFGATVGAVSEAWTAALDQHARTSTALAAHVQQAMGGAAASFDRRATALLAAVEDHHAAGQAALQATAAALAQQTTALQHGVVDAVTAKLDAVAGRIGASATAVSATWQDALAGQQRAGERLSAELQAALAGLVDGFGQQSAALLATVEQAHDALQQGAEAGDAQRLAAWTGSLASVAGTLQQGWQQDSAQALARQQQICQTLEQTAQAIHSQAGAQSRATIAEMAQLIATASEAPKAAADLVGQLRQKLSDSLANDNALLEERSRIMGTLSTLLDAVQQAATAQRGAIDALVGSAGTLLQQAGAQLGERIAAESAQLATAAAQVSGSAVEVASMGEAFGVAVQRFGDSSAALMAQLQRIEAAMARSTARSDEQLGYYVAQARELIDLSISSQQQIVEDLQQLAIRQLPVHGAAA